MTNFHDLFDYNHWANEQLLAETDHMTEVQLAEEMPELGGSTLDLLDHASLVEAAFLRLTTTDAPVSRPGSTRTYADVRETFRATSEGYFQAMPTLTSRLEEHVEVPWFERSFTVGQILLQVATHSVQHRAGVAAGIALAGREAPGLDYIMWLSQYR